MDFIEDETILQKPSPIYLGILGSRQDLKQEQVIEEVILPILEEMGRPPEMVITPTEGYTSIYISDWAERLKIPTQVYEADWYRHQRRAKLFRDLRIQKEATHFLIFLNKKSDFNEKTAIRLAKQGKTVFTVSYTDLTIEQLIDEPSSPEQPPLPAKPERKQGTGKGRASRLFQKEEVPGTQCLLRDLWEA